METITRLTVLVLCVLLGVVPVNARDDAVTFENLTREQGLSQSSINSIVQDSEGFMWFATQDGLNRYDGYTFTVFNHNPRDPHSLSDSRVRAILKDRTGTLWIGTWSEGLNKLEFIANTPRFIRYKHDAGNPRTLSNDRVFAVYEDRAGILWIGTWGGGLNKFNREKEVFTHYTHDPHNPGSLSHNNVRCIFEDRHGVLWVGTYGGGLNKFDRETGTFTCFQHSAAVPDSLSNNMVMVIFETGAGELWIGTNGGGLNVLERKKGTFRHYEHEPHNPGSLSHNSIRAIYEDRQGDLWIGTYGGGLNIFDPVKKTFTHYRHDPLNLDSLSHDRVLSIYEDRTELLWIGTQDGISIFDPLKPGFRHCKHNPRDPKSLSNNYVRAICRDRAGTLWVGTDEGGLNRQDKGKQGFTHYKHDAARPRSISNNRIYALYEDRTGTLWIGTFGGGLNKYDRQTDTFDQYKHNPDNPGSLGHDRIRALCEDRIGSLWVGTSGKGLDKLDRETGTFTHYTHQPRDPNTLSNDYVSSLCVDKDGILWIGTFGGGFNAFDPMTETFVHYRHIPGNPDSLSHNRIFSICEDRSGMLWAGSDGGGLNKYDRTTGRWTCYTVKDGLPNNVIYGILEDGNSNLWLSTNKGLSKFNPGTGEFFNYDIEDGLQGNEFNAGAYHKDRGGRELFFGGANGFNSFYPGDIKNNPYRPPVVITSFKIRHKLTPFHLPEQKKIKLAHKDGFFSISFVALNYRTPEKNRYAYKLENFDKDWIYCGSQRYARYTNLDGGTYTFRVKGSNNHGLWNETGNSIQIQVTPSFWKTWWFRGFASIFLVVLVFLVFRIRVAQINAANLRERSRELEEINKKLRQQIKEREAAQKGKRILEEKLVLYEKMEAVGRLAGGVAHDLNNVLSSMVGYPDLLLTKLPEDSPYRTIVLRIQKSAVRAAAIVEDLLTLARRRVDTEEVVNLNDIVNEYLQSLEYEKLQFFHPHVRLEVNLEKDLLNIKGSPVNLIKMVMNLVTNAAEAMPRGGTVTLSTANLYPGSQIISHGLPNHAVMTVTDTGVGIAKDDVKKIFEPFYTKKDMGRSGTGLGLTIVWNAVNDHRGYIDVTSEIGKGTTFEIYFPVPEGAGAVSRKKPAPKVEEYFGNGEHILVVDDMQDQREIATSLLSELGYVVSAVSGGEEAIEYMKTHAVDLVLLDMVMSPGIDGLDTYKEIRKLHPGTPTILLSGFSQTDRVKEAQRLGAGPYIKKPYSMGQIGRVVKTQLKKTEME